MRKLKTLFQKIRGTGPYIRKAYMFLSCILPFYFIASYIFDFSWDVERIPYEYDTLIVCGFYLPGFFFLFKRKFKLLTLTAINYILYYLTEAGYNNYPEAIFQPQTQYDLYAPAYIAAIFFVCYAVSVLPPIQRFLKAYAKTHAEECRYIRFYGIVFLSFLSLCLFHLYYLSLEASKVEMLVYILLFLMGLTLLMNVWSFLRLLFKRKPLYLRKLNVLCGVFFLIFTPSFFYLKNSAATDERKLSYALLREKFKDAKTIIARAEHKGYPTARFMYYEAVYYKEKKNFKQSNALLLQAEKNAPKSGELKAKVLWELADNYWTQENEAAYEKTVRRMIRFVPQSAYYGYGALSKVYLEKGKHEDALKHALLALDLKEANKIVPVLFEERKGAFQYVFDSLLKWGPETSFPAIKTNEDLTHVLTASLAGIEKQDKDKALSYARLIIFKKLL